MRQSSLLDLGMDFSELHESGVQAFENGILRTDELEEMARLEAIFRDAALSDAIDTPVAHVGLPFRVRVESVAAIREQAVVMRRDDAIGTPGVYHLNLQA